MRRRAGQEVGDGEVGRGEKENTNTEKPFKLVNLA